MHLKEIPFFFHSTDDASNEGLPLVFPFDYFFNESYQMFCQREQPELMAMLNTVYQKGSLADGSFSSASGLTYVEKIGDFIFNHVPNISDKKILEVGYGSGVILKALKSRGCKNLQGIEPGNHPEIEGIQDIFRVKDFFPSDKITGNFDVIYSLLVLEHIANPTAFLQNIKAQLVENGVVIIAVPNCEPYYETGDVSMFIHEHFGYYTKASLHNVAMSAGLRCNTIEIIEGALVAVLSKHTEETEETQHFEVKDFLEKANALQMAVQRFMEKYADGDVAVFAPIRAMNIMSALNKRDCIPVDDNPQIQGKFLPAFDKRIRSQQQLAAAPPKAIIIFSRTFGERIKQRLLNESAFANTEIVTLNDLN